MLNNKVAVIYGAAGAIGGATARAFAEEGAHVLLTGSKLNKVQSIAEEIRHAGGSAEAAQVDALDERAVEDHLDLVTRQYGRVDISFNAVGFSEIQGVPLVKLSLEEFSFPLASWTRTVFLTSRAAARRMSGQGSGVILTINVPSGSEGLSGGFGAASAAIRAISRTLAAEVGADGVRVICLQPNAVPESAALRRSVKQHADRAGRDLGALLDSMAESTLLKRLPKLRDVANVAVFAASDRASAITGSTLTIDCGASAA